MRTIAGGRTAVGCRVGGLPAAIRNLLQSAVLFAMFVTLGVPSLAQQRLGASKLIEIEQASYQPTVQVGRPIPTWWDVRLQGTALVEGRFEFAIKNEGRLLAHFTTEEMALAPPQQSIRIMLPPVDDPIGIDQLQLDVTFRGKRFTEVLSPQVLRVAMSRQRTFMVLTSNSRLAARRSDQRNRIRKRLAFESMLPAAYEDGVLSIYSPLEPDKLPSEPMTYCAYDLVVLFGDEFRSLKKPQLDAIATWIRAGGSLYVEPSGVLEPFHVDFLRLLTSGDPRGLTFQPDSSGRLVPGTIFEDERVVATLADLGRVVVRVDEERNTTDQDNTDYETAEWRRAVATLWRLRNDQIQAVVRNGVIDMKRIASNSGRIIDTDGDGFPDSLALEGGVIIRTEKGATNFTMPQGWLSSPLPTSTGELLDRLMPEGTRMVPLWLLGFILMSFVVLIGPVDYIGLGWLKARKYTWITFPTATILVTALTVWVSNTYMSSSDARRGLVVRDIAEDGSLLRTNRFELLFISSSRSLATDVQKGIFTAVGTGGQMAGNSVVLQQRQAMLIQQQFSGRPGSRQVSEEMSGKEPTPYMAGRIPAQFRVMQDIAKWTPQLNRLFWITGPAEEKSIDWKAITEGQFSRVQLASGLVSKELKQRVQREIGNEAAVALLTPNGHWAVDGSGLWRTSLVQPGRPDPFAVPGFYQGYDQSGSGFPREVATQGALFRWVYQHSEAQMRGLFALTSVVSPKGGAKLDDLPIFDSSNPDRALLIVLVPDNDDLIVYRKLVRVTR